MSPETYILAALGLLAVIFGPAGVMRFMVAGALKTLDRIERKVDQINGRVDEHAERIARLEERIHV